METKKIVTTVLASDFNINVGLKRWLDDMHIWPNIKIDRHDVPSARNSAVVDFLEGDGTHLLMIDNSVWPLADARVVFERPEDVVYMGHCATGGHIAHLGDGNLGCAFTRYSRIALESVEPPWFAYVHDATGSEMVKCECMYLRDKLKAAGYDTFMVGTIFHNVNLLERPLADGSHVEAITKKHFLRELS